MTEPPVLAGAVQERLIVLLPLAVAERLVGAPGTEAASSTNSIVSYGPNEPFLTPDGSEPKSSRRPSPVSLVRSGIARMSKPVTLSPTANVTLDGSPS